ncbi:sugar transferase [Ancylobacter sp. A5.8]|uniref:sugar transferase n=1 Tax=Ancylobacter gelatini TaxID=2919920 RepID=UPI001F4DBB70|nr:sugar transferase [Ancylobacter gelatini]MCJ8145224.1 sugar transferase [Ancylobacter gelatini]
MASGSVRKSRGKQTGVVYVLDDHSFLGIPTGPFSGSRPSDPLLAERAPGGAAKRILDVCIAATAGVLLSPVIMMTAVLIKASTDGPVVFAHRRVGFGGREFYCYKFRTMVCDAERVLQEHLRADPAAAEEWQLTRKLENDPRVTFIGRILRNSSLDELPQLLNVLRGEMSCVGPRPIVRDEIALYGQMAEHYMSVRPGMTGAWQVSGRSRLSYAERVAIDADYVRNWSFWTDVAIILRTIPALLRTQETS